MFPDKIRICLLVWLIALGCATSTQAAISPPAYDPNNTAAALGWSKDPADLCGGYFVDTPFTTDTHKITLVGQHGWLAKQGTSLLEGGVTLTRDGQQLTAQKMYLYRDPHTFKLVSAALEGDIRLREPNTLILADSGTYYFDTHEKQLENVTYRTALNGKSVVGPRIPKNEMQQVRRAGHLTAWGKAKTILQQTPGIYELTCASFSTCSPINPTWQVKGSRIVINKKTGRGQVTHMRLQIKSIPILYFPYVSFSIDHQRKSGFLWPTVNFISSSFGPSVLLPFYWNIAPNYDTTITTGILTKRGVQLTDRFRYLTPIHFGDFHFSILPDDRAFKTKQEQYRNLYQNSTDPTIQAELNELLDSSPTRKSVSLHDDARFNDHWSSHIDYNYAGDNYYLQDFGSNLGEITQNQLLQEGNLYYKGKNWDFTGRLQAYQTLHPIILGQNVVQNQYRRLPQLILNADYPTPMRWLEYFVGSEATHFDILKTPGSNTNLPVGNRLHLQPGVSAPLYFPYFYLNPRFQLALTDYQLFQTSDTDTPGTIHRGIPIFDVASGLSFDRNMTLLHIPYQQTLEPEVYYTYIPYRNQSSIPVFDTTVNTLTYDQIFNYNRFSGLDRIGDANQIGVGLTTRLIEEQTGVEKARLGMGEIVYFANRHVTLCNNNSCTDNPNNHSNYQRLSPLSAVLNYHVNTVWQFTANAIWNPVTRQIDNTTAGLHYQTDEKHIINIGGSYVFNGDIQSGSVINTAQNNLKLTDFSFVYPITSEVSGVGRWSEDWNFSHLQNLLGGVQYDTCCWTIRAVGGRAFTQLQNNTPQYQNEFYIQFALKGLGNIGTGDPSSLLSSINGYNTKFGQEF
jgi:LPS-assembly protein